MNALGLPCGAHKRAPTLAGSAGSLPPEGAAMNALGLPCGAHKRAPRLAGSAKP
jgi:hypothetical protein